MQQKSSVVIDICLNICLVAGNYMFNCRECFRNHSEESDLVAALYFQP